MTGRLHRLTTIQRPSIEFMFDGQPVSGLQGDTILSAILSHRGALREAEFGPEHRAGFCLMGACQDCWVWQEEGRRLRACSTELQAGLRLRSKAPDGWVS
ncbi:(2Fe-2S)-binding protein [Pseudophaeobacter arcticus]|uniref:(2Fe-2S)-binding protein n=1 Tax=Pseudophaeobacter arcticus TaxID=385492 RepID=UPI003A97DBCA